jgi:hypothetical protein
MIMGRLVRKSRIGDGGLSLSGLDDIFVPEAAGTQAATKSELGDNYLERAVKYVPAEVIAFSMVVNAIFDQALKNSGQNAVMAGLPVTSIAWAALIVGLILTPVYCWHIRTEDDAWIINALVSTVAFPFWAYLTGAVAFADFHDGNLAAILVMTFTAVSGLIKPSPAQPRRHEVQSTAGEPNLPDKGTNLRERITELFEASARVRHT